MKVAERIHVQHERAERRERVVLAVLTAAVLLVAAALAVMCLSGSVTDLP